MSISFVEIMKTNYLLKIAGVIWFDGVLPSSPDEETDYRVLLENADSYFERIQETEELYGEKSLEELEEISLKMTEPQP